MIIIIKETPDLTVDGQNKTRVLENIVVSFGECRHVVWMPVATVSDLLSMTSFGEYTRRVLFELRSFVVESRGIERSFSFYLDVDFENGRRLEFDGDKVLHVGYMHFVDSMKLRPPVLLTENLRDAEIFRLGAEAYLHSENFYRLYGLSLEHMPGGGNTTFDVFEYLERNESFFLCVIDSDLKHPRGPIGDTAKRFSHTQTGYLGRRCLKILECHEVENIIPLSIVREVSNGAIDDGLIHKLNRVITDRQHPDHKAGLTVARAKELDEEYGGDYWSPYYAFDARARDVWIVPPLGENLLSNCLKVMAQQSIGKLSEKISAELDRTWLELSQNVASWGVSMRKRIN